MLVGTLCTNTCATSRCDSGGRLLFTDVLQCLLSLEFFVILSSMTLVSAACSVPSSSWVSSPGASRPLSSVELALTFEVGLLSLPSLSSRRTLCPGQHAKQHASHKHHDVADADGHVRAEASILDRRSRTSKSKRKEAMYSA